MNIPLTVVLGLMLSLFAAVGVKQGVYRALLACVGPLLGAVTIDLWRDTLTTQFVGNAALRLGIIIPVFLTIVFVIGYGSVLLFPTVTLEAPTNDLRSLILSAFLGLLNGMLVFGYLLRYIRDFAVSATLAHAIESALFTTTLYAWLPWFIVAVLSATGGWISIRFIQRRTSVALPAAKPVSAVLNETPPSKVTDPATRERLQTVNQKISQRLRDV